MDFGHRGVDVTVRQIREPDVAIGVVAAEVRHPRVVDAHHLVGGLDVLELRGGGEDAVDDLGVHAVAVHLLDAQMRIARPADPLLAVLVEAPRRPHVDAITSTRSCLPGTCFVPEAPTPPAIPNLTPFFATHHRSPSGPSATYGMRSFKACGAWDVKRSGGSQIRSRWQSAEIRL